jgi:hypothetical protein
MSAYHIWGTISTVFFLSSILAIFHQLRLIWKRKKLVTQGQLQEKASQSISVNQVFSSYCGVYSFFLFGLVLDSPDPFLMYPRAVVGLLLYMVVRELYKDRMDRPCKAAFFVCSLSLLVPIVLLLTGTRSASQTQSASHAVVCAATLLMAQGALSQWRVLRRSGKRGAVSLPMHLVLYGKDFTGMMFGFQIGVSAWSIILMHASNLVMRAPIIYSYLKSAR